MTNTTPKWFDETGVFHIDTSAIAKWLEVKVTDQEWKELMNTLSDDVIKQVGMVEKSVEEVLINKYFYVRPTAYQDPKTWEITDEYGNPLDSNSPIKVWTVKAPTQEAANQAAENIRVTKIAP